MYTLVSSPGSLHVSHWRAWYFFAHDLTYTIAHGQDRSKDGCAFLPLAGDSVSALSLWHKRAPKSRFVAFLRCLKTAAVLAHKILPPYHSPHHAHEKKYQAHSCAKVKHTRGPGNEAACAHINSRPLLCCSTLTLPCDHQHKESSPPSGTHAIAHTNKQRGSHCTRSSV